MRKLEGKTAIITGVASGIGKETGFLFAKEGAYVIGADINVNEGEKVINEIRQLGKEAMFIKTDVSHPQDIQNLIEKGIEKGKIDIFFNNAGIEVVKSLLDSTEDDWNKTIDVNLKSVFLTCKMIIPYMIKEKNGVIINNASVAGVIGSFSPVYSASKGGIIAFSKAIAVDYAKDNIRINSISPGAIETPMLDRVNSKLGVKDEIIKSRLKNYPMGRFGKVNEIANTVLFLALDHSSFITGQNIIIDGGFSSH